MTSDNVEEAMDASDMDCSPTQTEKPDMQQLRSALVELRRYRQMAQHRPGTKYHERQMGEIVALDFVLRLIDGEDLLR